MTTLWRKALQSLETIRGDLGVYDGANRVYSDSNPPQSLMRTQFAPASLVTPASGFADEATPDGKSLWMKAPDGTVTLIGPGSDPFAPMPSDLGYKTWMFDPIHAAGTTPAPTSGTLNLLKLPLRGSTVISSATVNVNTAGASLTAVGFALYTAAGVLLTSSVNVNGATAAAFQATGIKTVTFTPQTISASFYLAFWFTGTTIPVLNKTTAGSTVINAGLSAPNLRVATANTGLTTTAPATLGTQTAASNPFWAAAA